MFDFKLFGCYVFPEISNLLIKDELEFLQLLRLLLEVKDVLFFLMDDSVLHLDLFLLIVELDVQFLNILLLFVKLDSPFVDKANQTSEFLLDII